MTNVDDSICWHEPYLNARRFGKDGPDVEEIRAILEKSFERRGADYKAAMDIVKTSSVGYFGSEVNYQWVKEQLEADAPGKKLIFNKDMVEGIVDKYDALPEGFRHTFLLRHPLKVFRSFKKMADGAQSDDEVLDIRKLSGSCVMPQGYFYKELYELYKHVKESKKDTKPIVICTKDLQGNPEGTMKAYFRAIGLEFTEKVLKWADDGDSIMAKWMVAKEETVFLSDIHKTVFDSTGFGEPSELPDRDGMDEDVLELADKCMPYYEKMLKAKINAER